MNVSAIKNLHLERYLKILSKLNELYGEGNLSELPYMELELPYIRVFIYYMSKKITNEPGTLHFKGSKRLTTNVHVLALSQPQ